MLTIRLRFHWILGHTSEVYLFFADTLCIVSFGVSPKYPLSWHFLIHFVSTRLDSLCALRSSFTTWCSICWDKPVSMHVWPAPCQFQRYQLFPQKKQDGINYSMIQYVCICMYLHLQYQLVNILASLGSSRYMTFLV